MQLSARFSYSLFRLDISVRLNAHLDTLLKGMGLLVASKPNSVVFEQLITNNIAQGVVLLLDEYGGGILAARVIYTLDEITWLDLRSSYLMVSPDRSCCHLLIS